MYMMGLIYHLVFLPSGNKKNRLKNVRHGNKHKQSEKNPSGYSDLLDKTGKMNCKIITHYPIITPLWTPGTAYKFHFLLQLWPTVLNVVACTLYQISFWINSWFVSNMIKWLLMFPDHWTYYSDECFNHLFCPIKNSEAGLNNRNISEYNALQFNRSTNHSL